MGKKTSLSILFKQGKILRKETQQVAVESMLCFLIAKSILFSQATRTPKDYATAS